MPASRKSSESPAERALRISDPQIRNSDPTNSPDDPTARERFPSDTFTNADEPRPPPTLRARYHDLKRIAEGAMGTLYRGWDPLLGRVVAVKLLKSDAPADTRRFLTEARAQARVRHENVCQVYEAGEADGEPYIIMEFIEGESLDVAHKEMTLEQKIKVIREVAAALHEAHRLGMVHRDVKPTNIMVARQDDTYKPYVVDFGLARDVSSTSASTQNGIVGTPAYMSPEQAMGTATVLDRRTDVYSLGATLYEILAGRTPFVGSNALTLLTQVMYEDPPTLGSVRRGIPKQLEAIVMTCIERDPERRYDSARALGDDLQRFLDGGQVQAKPIPLSYLLLRKAKRHKALVAVGAIGLSVALVLGGMWIRSAQQASVQAELARELGEDVKYVELFLRSAYGFPAHDTDREERIVRARIVGIEQRMNRAGRIGEGPGHYALGRAHAALHEYESARIHLIRALAAGYEKPEVHYALGLALGGRYQEEVDAARRVDASASRDELLKLAETRFRDPALAQLRASLGSDVELSEYVHGLIALYEQRHDDAARYAERALEQAPWLYEAYKLEGDAHLEAGIARTDRGEKEEARRHFDLAIDAYRRGSDIARSDSSMLEALAEAWIQILILDIWAGRNDSSALTAVRAACDAAIIANPRSAKPHVRKGRAYFHIGSQQLRSGVDPRAALRQAIENGQKAHELDARDAISMDGVGVAQAFIGEYERKLGLDAIPSLEQAVKSLDEATHIEPTLAWAWSDAGLAFLFRTNYEIEKGLDPRRSIHAGLDRFARAAQEDPRFTSSYANAVFMLAIQAGYELSIGLDPRPTVKRAVENAEMGAKIDPKWLPLLNNRGWAELVAAQYEENTGADPSQTLDNVEKALQASLDINKDEADTQFGMGSAKHVRTQYQIRKNLDPQKYADETLAFLKRATELDSQEPGIRLELGQFYLTMARYAIGKKQSAATFLDDAEKIFREGLRLNARHAPLHAALAETLAMRAEYVIQNESEREKTMTEGLSEADESLRQNPKWALAMAANGTLFALRAASKKDPEDQRRAIEWFDKAFAINAKLPERFKTRLEQLRQSPTAGRL